MSSSPLDDLQWGTLELTQTTDTSDRLNSYSGELSDTCGVVWFGVIPPDRFLELMPLFLSFQHVRLSEESKCDGRDINFFLDGPYEGQCFICFDTPADAEAVVRTMPAPVLVGRRHRFSISAKLSSYDAVRRARRDYAYEDVPAPLKKLDLPAIPWWEDPVEAAKMPDTFTKTDIYRLRGLPFETTPADIDHFLKPVRDHCKSVEVGKLQNDEACSGNLFVELTSPEYGYAMLHLHNTFFPVAAHAAMAPQERPRPRFVEVTASSAKERAETLASDRLKTRNTVNQQPAKAKRVDLASGLPPTSAAAAAADTTAAAAAGGGAASDFRPRAADGRNGCNARRGFARGPPMLPLADQRHHYPQQLPYAQQQHLPQGFSSSSQQLPLPYRPANPPLFVPPQQPQQPPHAMPQHIAAQQYAQPYVWHSSPPAPPPQHQQQHQQQQQTMMSAYTPNAPANSTFLYTQASFPSVNDHAQPYRYVLQRTPPPHQQQQQPSQEQPLLLFPVSSMPSPPSSISMEALRNMHIPLDPTVPAKVTIFSSDRTSVFFAAPTQGLSAATTPPAFSPAAYSLQGNGRLQTSVMPQLYQQQQQQQQTVQGFYHFQNV